MNQYLIPNTNLEVYADSICLRLLPLKDSVYLYRGDRVVIAELNVHPADKIDSIWVKLAHSEQVQGWIREKDIIDHFVPTDSISQFIHFFSNTYASYLLAGIALLICIGLYFLSRKKPIRLVFFKDIQSVYPTLLCLLTAISGTLYGSLQIFSPQVWQQFYFHPTLSPAGLPFMLSMFLATTWAILVIGIASIEESFRYLSAGKAFVYLLGLFSCSVFSYFFFSLTTPYYVGYIFLGGFFLYFIKRLFDSTRNHKYRCGRCGWKLKEKGKCPECGVMNE